MIGLAAFDLTATAVGYSLLSGLRVAAPSLGSIRFVCLAFFSGWALLGIGLSFGVMAGLDPDLLVGLLVAAAPSAAASRRAGSRRRSRRRARRGPPRSVARVVGIGGAGIVLLTLGVGLLEVLHARRHDVETRGSSGCRKRKVIYYFHGLDTGLSGFTTYGNPSTRRLRR